MVNKFKIQHTISKILIFLSLLGMWVALAPESLPFIEKFIKITQGLVTYKEIENKLNIEMTPTGYDLILGSGVVGSCDLPWFGNKGKISLDPNKWERTDDLERWALILHELGHCACTLSHTVEIKDLPNDLIKDLFRALGFKIEIDDRWYFEDGCPNSIMFPYIPEYTCLEKHIKEYETKLVKECKPWTLYEVLNLKRKNK